MVIHRGEVLGLVGESASGKTTVGTSLLDYQRRGAKIAEGHVEIDGQDILAMDPKALRGVRGGRISYVPQDSSAALNPALRIGTQLMEILEVHGFGSSQADREARLAQMMAEVLLPSDKAVPAPVPAPALRRPAAARGHRHGVRQPAQGHRARRADHRAGRDHAGARAGDRPRPHQVLRSGGALHHPRPRRGLQPRRPHRRHVRRQGGRDRHARRAVRPGPPPVHAQAARLHPRHHRRARPARHPRLGASSGTATPRLCVHPALRLGGRQVQRGVPARRGGQSRPPRALLAPAGGRRAGAGARGSDERAHGDRERLGRQAWSSACGT